LGEISGSTVTGSILETDANGELDTTKIPEVHFDSANASANVIAEPLRSVEHREKPTYVFSVGGDLHEVVIRTTGATGIDIQNRRNARRAAIGPILQCAIFEIIDLPEHYRLCRRTEEQKRDSDDSNGGSSEFHVPPMINVATRLWKKILARTRFLGLRFEGADTISIAACPSLVGV
jgi:hypothetical protein